jgi:transposase
MDAIVVGIDVFKDKLDIVQVRAFAKALGQRAKTDPIDAMVIARFAMATKPEIRPLPDEATRFLNDLVCRRRQISEMIVAEKQRAMRLSNKRLLHCTAQQGARKRACQPRHGYGTRFAGLARKRRPLGVAAQGGPQTCGLFLGASLH